MGGTLAALSLLINKGSHAPHINTHFDCSCSDDPSSSDQTPPNERKTWLQKHRPDAEEVVHKKDKRHKGEK